MSAGADAGARPDAGAAPDAGSRPDPRTRPDAGAPPVFDAIVLAGGRSARLGTPKAELRIGGTTLLERALEAAAPARRIVVVGPERALPAGVLSAREEPAFGGPVAAIGAGLAALDAAGEPAAELLLLPCDVPEASRARDALFDGEPGPDGTLLDDGRPQPLPARIRTSALRSRLSAIGDPHGRPLGALFDGLRFARIADPASIGADVDTWQDVGRARRTEGAAMADTPAELDRWVAALAADLGFDADAVPVGAVLDLARDAAHGVARPAAPLTAFLVGLAAEGDPARFEELATRARALAAAWPPEAPETDAPAGTP